MQLFFPHQVQYKTTKQSDSKVIDHFDPEQTTVIHTCAKVWMITTRLTVTLAQLSHDEWMKTATNDAPFPSHTIGMEI